jgi:hypothetical protein
VGHGVNRSGYFLSTGATFVEPNETTQPRWYWNVPILLLVGILVSLGIRGLIKDDARYSWGTFCKQVIYEVDYRWVMRDPDGTEWTIKHEHEGELRGEAKTHLEGLPKQLNTRYSLGAVKSWIAAYTRYMFEHSDDFVLPPQSKVVGFTAEVAYRENVSRKLRVSNFKETEKDSAAESPTRRLFFAYPLTIKDPRPGTEPTPAEKIIGPGVSVDKSTNVKDDDE